MLQVFVRGIHKKSKWNPLTFWNSLKDLYLDFTDLQTPNWAPFGLVMLFFFLFELAKDNFAFGETVFSQDSAR